MDKPETPFGEYLKSLRSGDSAHIPDSAKAFNAQIAQGYAGAQSPSPVPMAMPAPKPPLPAVPRTSRGAPSSLPPTLEEAGLGDGGLSGMGVGRMTPLSRSNGGRAVVVRPVSGSPARMGSSLGRPPSGALGALEPSVKNAVNPAAPPTPGPPRSSITPKLSRTPVPKSLPSLRDSRSSSGLKEATVKRRLIPGQSGVEVATPLGEILSFEGSGKGSTSKVAQLFEPVSTTPPMTAREMQVSEYNSAVRTLKKKIYEKGPFAITQHFQNLDADGSGSLEHEEFKKAIALFNVDVSDEVINRLLREVDVDGSGAIDYREFTDALRMGKIRMEKSDKRRTVNKQSYNMDPDLPFGNPKHLQPYGIMLDADINLEKYDESVDEMFGTLEQIFHEFDEDGSGEIDREEFINAMQHLNHKRDLKLSREEIVTLFKNADADGSGSIEYGEFLSSFAGGGGKRFIPEFLKPKASRCSQMGHPWLWNSNVVNEAPVEKIGSRAFEWGEEVNDDNLPAHLIAHRARIAGASARLSKALK